jgi:hypothetical protein
VTLTSEGLTLIPQLKDIHERVNDSIGVTADDTRLLQQLITSLAPAGEIDDAK